MLKQATVQDISNRRITRVHGRIVVVTHFYPRFLKRNLVDEYHRSLAPPRALLKQFKDKEKELGDHDLAFTTIDYESQFWLSDEGFAELQKLAIEAGSRAVYLVCHCKVGQRCHREILMVIAHKMFGAPIAKLSFDWSRFRARLDQLGQTDATSR